MKIFAAGGKHKDKFAYEFIFSYNSMFQYYTFPEATLVANFSYAATWDWLYSGVVVGGVQVFANLHPHFAHTTSTLRLLHSGTPRIISNFAFFVKKKTFCQSF